MDVVRRLLGGDRCRLQGGTWLRRLLACSGCRIGLSPCVFRGKSMTRYPWLSVLPAGAGVPGLEMVMPPACNWRSLSMAAPPTSRITATGTMMYPARAVAGHLSRSTVPQE